MRRLSNRGEHGEGWEDPGVGRMLAVLLSARRKDKTAGTTAAMVTVLTLPCETSLSLCAIDPDAD